MMRMTRPDVALKRPTREETAILDRHAAYVEDLVQQGTALVFGRAETGDAYPFELLIFRADDEESAERLVFADPAVAEGVMSAELLPFEMSLLSETWEP
jgi:uncharacterized protein YciI